MALRDLPPDECACRIINVRNFMDENTLVLTFDDIHLVEIGGIDKSLSQVEYLEVLITKLQFYQDSLQVVIDNRKNRKKLKEGIYIKLSHIYLMKDKRNGFHKIGRSINPEFREKTLQSEMPDIECSFISPLTFNLNEKRLHILFKEKRIRGEWFDLNIEDVDYIKKFDYGTS